MQGWIPPQPWEKHEVRRKRQQQQTGPMNRWASGVSETLVASHENETAGIKRMTTSKTQIWSLVIRRIHVV